MKERKRSKEEVLKFLEKLPEGRKIYYQFGPVMVEVTKDEALELLKEEEE